jgi:hypothetical protein
LVATSIGTLQLGYGRINDIIYKSLNIKKISGGFFMGKNFKEEWQENFIDFNIGNTTSI